MTETEAIQQNCKRFREEMGVTQQELAAAIEMSVDVVRKWEQKKGTPDRDSLRRLARYYGRAIEDFYSESPPPPREVRAGHPAFALKVVDKDADPELRRRAEEFLRQLNQEHFARVEEIKRAQAKQTPPPVRPKGKR